jgi:hypothetical protein
LVKWPFLVLWWIRIIQLPRLGEGDYTKLDHNRLIATFFFSLWLVDYGCGLVCRVVSCRVVYFPTSIFLILIPNINFPKLKTITQPYKMDPTTKLQRIHYIFISIFLLVIHTALLIHFCSLNFLFLSPIWLFLLVHRDGYPYYHIY